MKKASQMVFQMVSQLASIQAFFQVLFQASFHTFSHLLPEWQKLEPEKVEGSTSLWRYTDILSNWSKYLYLCWVYCLTSPMFRTSAACQLSYLYCSPIWQETYTCLKIDQSGPNIHLQNYDLQVASQELKSLLLWLGTILRVKTIW